MMPIPPGAAHGFQQPSVPAAPPTAHPALGAPPRPVSAPTQPARQMPAPTGPAVDIRPSTPTATPQIGATPATQTAAPSGPAATSPSPMPGSYATLQTTTPGNSLLGQTILPGPGVDRYNLANQQFNTFQQQTNPAYEASLRDANRYAAAGGALGSGMLNTSVGDLANQRNLQLQGAQQSFLQNALNGSIEDQYRNLGILQQQQGFQQQQANDAFGQGLAQSQLGYEGNPSSTSMLLANLYGNNAAQAGAGVGQLVQNAQMNQAMQNNPMWAILAGQYGGNNIPQQPTDTTSGGSYGIPSSLPWLNQYGGFGG